MNKVEQEISDELFEIGDELFEIMIKLRKINEKNDNY